jgi:hypothetical protein
MPEWLDKLQDTAIDVGDNLRYGMPFVEKNRRTWTGEIPGAPNRDTTDPATERYASAYLGAKNLSKVAPGSGASSIVPILFNVGAFHDLMNPSQALRNKASGIRGALAGAYGLSPDGDNTPEYAMRESQHPIASALMRALGTGRK